MDLQQILNVFLGLLIGTLTAAVPLVFASLGGLFSERSGIVQIALEGMMLFGALMGATFAYFTHSAWLGLLAAVVGSTLVSLVYAFFVLVLEADQIVIGTAINIFIFGGAPLLTKSIFSSTGATPSLDVASRFSVAPPLIALAMIGFIYYLFYHTRAGLLLRFAGESPEVLSSSGISVFKVRVLAQMMCGVMTGLGGASLSLFLASSYSPNMTAGRGFIALAALIFGQWKPVPTVLACLFFAFIDAAQVRLQSHITFIPGQFVQILPYIVTIIAIAGFFGRSQAPKALGQNAKSL